MAKLTLYNVLICTVVTLGGFSYGFGFAIFISSLGQPSLYTYFKLDPTSTYTANIIGAINALFAFGAASGAIVQGWTADWLGRKKALALGAICAVVGAALTAGSVAISELVIVRLFHGFGLGQLMCLVPLYTTEVAPAHRRGLLTGMLTMAFGTGYMLCAWISVGTFHATSAGIQWRLPIALACIGPLGLLVGLFFVPETPRYLSWAGRDDEAWTVIQRLHHDSNDPADAIARAEFIQITRQVAFDKLQKSGYLQMFSKPSWRRRSLSVMFLLFASQSTGILGITNFMILIYESLGMTGDMPLIMYGIYTILGTVFVFIAVFNIDRIGRRRLFLIGFPTVAACLLAEGLLQVFYLGTTNKPGNAACVSLFFLYILCFQCIDAPSFVWAAEIFPTNIRAKGLGLTFFAYFVGAITYTTPSALAFKNIKWGMYFLYCGLCLIAELIVYLYIPETKCVPIEELGGLFGDEVVVHLATDGHLADTVDKQDNVWSEKHKLDAEKGLVMHEETVHV